LSPGLLPSWGQARSSDGVGRRTGLRAVAGPHEPGGRRTCLRWAGRPAV